jgi:hypothetical protein
MNQMGTGTTRARALVSCGIAAILPGCGGYSGICGTVRVHPDATEGAALPVTGARVTLACPGQSDPVFRVESDGSGRFEHPLREPVSNACLLVIEKPGLVARKIRILDVCVNSGRKDQCRVAVVTGHLVRLGAP